MIHEGKKPLKCEICSLGSSNAAALKRHVSSVHEGKKTSKFEVFEKSFTTKGNLNMHVSSVHEGRKAFKYDFCVTSFTTKMYLGIHIASEEKKPFKCAICDFGSSTATNLERHVSSVHEGKKQSKYEFCDKCFCFTTKGSLDYHIASVHEEKKHLSNREICKKGKLL